MRLGMGIVCALTLAAPAVRAQAIDNVGNAGQIVIGAERLTGVFVNKTEVKFSETVGGLTFTSESKLSTTTVSVFGSNPSGPSDLPRLALDGFVVQGLSLGGSFLYITRSGDSEATVTSTGAPAQTVDAKAPTDSIFVIAPRIGYAYAFDETVAIWPRVGFSYASLVRERETETTDINGNPITITETTTTKQTNLTLEALLVVSPFSHFALAGGPFYDVGLGGSIENETDEPNVPSTDGDYLASAFGFTAGILAYF